MSMTDVLQSLLADMPGMVAERAHLLALELRLARASLVQILMCVLAAALMASTAWMALWIATAAIVIQAGLDWAWALAATMAVNAGLALWMGLRIRALLPRLTLPATLRRLTLQSAPEGAAPEDLP